jgi:phosphoribosylglycinamide formyltransferase 1
MSLPRAGVLVSGSGTNLQALIDTVHGREVEIACVASSRSGVRALERAATAGIDDRAFPVDAFADRVARDAAMADWLAEHGVTIVVLAGYMQLLTPGFLARFPQAVLNIHPSLLPAFPGVRAIEQAIEYGVRVIGVTVHFVDEGVDSGPIVLQRAIELPEGEDPDAVLDRLHAIEHELLPEAVRLLARGSLSIDPAHPRRVLIDRSAG